MRAATFSMLCLVGVFATLTLNHFYPSKMAYSLVAVSSGATAAVYWFKELWRNLKADWLSGFVIVLVAVFTVALPLVQYVLQAPSLYISAMVFGGLVVGALRHRLPECSDGVDLNS
jgi:hypothetical protein